MDIMKYNVLSMYQHVLINQINLFQYMLIMEHNVDFLEVMMIVD